MLTNIAVIATGNTFLIPVVQLETNSSNLTSLNKAITAVKINNNIDMSVNAHVPKALITPVLEPVVASTTEGFPIILLNIA